MRHGIVKWLSILAASLIMAWSGAATASAKTAGKVTRIEGTVTFQRGASKVSAKIGTEVLVGDVIVTGANSRVKLLMLDGTLLNVAPSSKFVIEDFSNGNPHPGTRYGNYNLVYGRGRAVVPKGKIPPKVRIRTPTAVAGVRGTEIIFQYDPATGQTQIIAVDGSLVVVNPDQPGNEVTLSAGMGTTIGSNMIPTNPVMIDPALIQNLQQGTQGTSPAPRTVIKVTIPGSAGTTGTGVTPPVGGTGTGGTGGGDGVVGSPEDLIDQEPPPFTPVIININLNP